MKLAVCLWQIIDTCHTERKIINMFAIHSTGNNCPG